MALHIIIDGCNLVRLSPELSRLDRVKGVSVVFP
jgi:hypothetical protein